MMLIIGCIAAACILIVIIVPLLEGNLNREDTVWFISCLIIGLLALSAVVYDISYNRGYKQGQIDVLIGKVKYELKINPDSTRTWNEIKTKESKHE